jgi:TatD DNase family protein
MLRDDFDRHGPLHGVLHSYTGDAASAAAAVSMGLYVSFAGMLTYKNADALRAVAAQIPRDRLVVETDSPYLVPMPHRGKIRINEPAFVVHTGACLADLHGLPIEAMAALTTANARRLFKLPSS